jgi:class 3 adenylate cyclase
LIEQGQEIFPKVLRPQCRLSDPRQTIRLSVGPCPYSVIARPVKPFYDPRWGGWEIPLAGEQRRLAAIVAADVVGYSRLMGRDESGTRAPQIAVRREAFDLRIAAHAYCAGMSMRGTQ